MRPRDLAAAAERAFVAAGIPAAEARLDAELLLRHVLGWDRATWVAGRDDDAPADLEARSAPLVARRAAREPVAYIRGVQAFYGRDFAVGPGVLVPRPETELLIEEGLAALATVTAPRVLDIGTGSGAIAVSLATELPSAQIIATDISPAALEVARRNAERNGVAGRISLLPGDLFAAFDGDVAAFDLMVSNPPYIRRAEIATLEPEVNRWEPRGALDGGIDGMEFYRRIAAQAWRFLTPKGALALEIGADMGREVCPVFNQAERYREVAVFQDYAGRDRVAVARIATDLACSN